MRRLFIVFLFIFSVQSLQAQTNVDLCQRDSITEYALSFLKTPYVWGGTSPKGFDCSGFIYYVFKHFNIPVSRSSSGLDKCGDNIDLKQAQPADLLLFTGTDASIRKVGHVGMVLKNENGTIDFIHSSSSKRHFGVTITRFNNSGYVKRFLTAKAII